MINRQIKREFKDTILLLGKEILVVTLVGKMPVEDLADFILDGQSGLPVLEPVLNTLGGWFSDQALEQRLSREANSAC